MERSWVGRRILSKDQMIGIAILIASIVGIIAYGWLIYAFPLIVLQATAFIAVAVVLVILAWIGWTMATTPPPPPLDLEPISNIGEPKPTPSKDDSKNKGD